MGEEKSAVRSGHARVDSAIDGMAVESQDGKAVAVGEEGVDGGKLMPIAEGKSMQEVGQDDVVV
jgi:hypothetical protein